LFLVVESCWQIDVRGDDGQQSLLHQAMESYKIGSFTGGASGSFMYLLRSILV
jgi:hypothetical protein